MTIGLKISLYDLSAKKYDFDVTIHSTRTAMFSKQKANCELPVATSTRSETFTTARDGSRGNGLFGNESATLRRAVDLHNCIMIN